MIQVFCFLEETALHLAVKHNYIDMVSLLVSESNISINLQNHVQLTPFDVAIDRSFFEIARILSEHGGIPNISETTSVDKIWFLSNSLIQ